MDVPRETQLVLSRKIEAGIANLLPRDDLAGGGGLRLGQVARFKRQGRLALVRHAMALGAVLVGGILDAHKLGLELAVRLESIRVPGPPVARAFDEARPEQGCRDGVAKLAGLQAFDAGCVVGFGGMAQQAVHLHHTRLGPIPRRGLPGSRVKDAGFRAAERTGQQRLAGARCGRRAAADDTRTRDFEPFGSREVQPLVARLCQVAVGQRVELAKEAAGGVPRHTGRRLAGRSQIAQTQIGMKGVGADEGSVVTGAAGFFERDRVVGPQDGVAVRIEQRKGGMDRRRLASRSCVGARHRLFSRPCAQAHEHQRQQAEGHYQAWPGGHTAEIWSNLHHGLFPNCSSVERVEDRAVAGCASLRLPHSIGSPG